MKTKASICGSCGDSSDKYFEVDVELNEKGVPYSFTVYKGPFVFGGFGTPDQMVMSCMYTASKYWEKHNKKSLRIGDYVASVGLHLADEMWTLLTDEVKKTVLCLIEEDAIEVSMN